MLRSIFLRTIGVVAGCLTFAAVAADAPPALLLHGGTIYTGNPSQPKVEAVLAVGGRIAYVGDQAGALMRTPKGARVVDLAGRTMFPGLTDSHAHLADIGERELGFDLTGIASVEAMKQRLAERAAVDRSPWVVGANWIESKWKPAVFPSRQDLDAVVRDRPVVLQRVDGHAVVVNSKALEVAGITRTTPDPEGGQILRDPATGEPTGILVDNAMDLVWRQVPPETDELLARHLEAGAGSYVRLGWTEMQYAGTSWRAIDQLCRLYAAGKVQLRVYAAIGGPGEDAEKLLAAGRDYKSCDPRLTVRTIKLFMDGALGSRGAALDEPYSDSPGNRGLYVTPPEEILRIATAALRRGIQVETHAIGDRGNRVALDAYEAALKAVPTVDHRFRIEHVQVLDHADVPRFAQLGVIPAMQAVHQTSDMYWAPTRLGYARTFGAYAWRSLLNTGVIIPNGSDFPVERVNPLYSFHSAVSRQDDNSWPPGGWFPEQRMTRDEALKSMTIWAAFAGFQEQLTGSLTPGKYADFVILDQDIMTIPETSILGTGVVATYIGGKAVFERKR